MPRIIAALLLAIAMVPAWSDSPPGAGPTLATDAPDRYTVQRGDTLWGIASRFLKDPYRWPELWRLNASDVRRPHYIYPGQVLLLAQREPEPRLEIAEPVAASKASPQVYTTTSVAPIPAIPPRAIEAFLGRPLIVDGEAVKNMARIVAVEEGRLIAGAGDKVYATGIKSEARQWSVFRPGKGLRDPETGEELAMEAQYLGMARLDRKGDPATLEMLTSGQEIGVGDRLQPSESADLARYLPHAPAQPISARIISVSGAVDVGSNHSVVTLSRGSRDGMEEGFVLALFRAGNPIEIRQDDRRETHTLPHERYGLVFVFRVFERVSYGLVVRTDTQVQSGDLVGKP